MFRNNDLDCLHNRLLTGSHLALSLVENKWPKHLLAKKQSPSLCKNKSRRHQVNNILLRLSGCLCYSCSTNKHWSLVTCLHVWAFKSWQPQPSFTLIPPKKFDQSALQVLTEWIWQGFEKEIQEANAKHKQVHVRWLPVCCALVKHTKNFDTRSTSKDY